MKKVKIIAKELRTIGFPESPVIPVAMSVVDKFYKFSKKEDVIELLKNVLAQPADYKNDPMLESIALKLLPKEAAHATGIALRESGVPISIFGPDYIEAGALHQIHMAAKLPISVKAALMPDAHHGYGLPIGGVLATKNAVIPYGVGVDIGCRMCLSVFDMDPDLLKSRTSFFSREIHEATLFGSGAQFKTTEEHEIMDRDEFHSTPLLRSLHGKAWKQLGSSGSGNHFVEFGVVEISEKDEVLGIEPGKYIGLLSHSGSRGLGANIANHYTKLAIEKRKLPNDAKNLAWLDLNEAEGQEYWLAMNLAGDYASACHHIIHRKIARQLGRTPIKMVENHHNFAWKEMLDGEEVIVHRKGATPAGKNVLGIIPGSMSANGFIVKGRGTADAIHSAAHGAGRKLSRSAAISSITHKAMRDALDKAGVTLLGGGLDEAPFAYKDIHTVMSAQTELVDVVGSFVPKIVKMCGDGPKQLRKRNASDGE